MTHWHKALAGLSVEGRELSFYLSHKDTGVRLDTLILGAFHGDEPESAELTQAFLEAELNDLEDKQVGMVPIVNPDGLSQRRRTNANLVDLNRNFPTKDWQEQEKGTPYYSGPANASEPETQFLLKIIEAYNPAKIITVHTPYRVINYDGPAKALAEAMAKPTGYPVTEDIGYATPGSFGTYCGKERNIPTVTLELPEEGFTDEELKNNLEGLFIAISFPYHQ